MRAAVAVLLIGSLLLAGCMGPPASGPTGSGDGAPTSPWGNRTAEVPWWRNATGETLREPRGEPCPTGPERCLEEPGLIVFHDQERFRNFSKRHLGDSGRGVHFEHEVVLVGIGGWQPNLCPTVTLREPRHHPNMTVVPLVLLDIQAFCPEAIGYPVTVDTIEDPRAPVKWTYRTVTAYRTTVGLWNFSEPTLNPFQPQELFSVSGARMAVTPDTANHHTALNVTVENTGGSNLTLAGPACGTRLARSAPDTWEVFAWAPGPRDARTHVPVNGTCTAEVNLTSMEVPGNGTLGDSLEPGKYRVAAFGWETRDGERSRDFLSANLTVERRR